MATVEITTENFGPTIEGNDIVIVDFWNGTQLDSVIDAVKALDMSEVHAAVAAKENEGDTAQ